MKKTSKILSAFLALAMAFTLAVPAFASGGEIDVTPDDINCSAAPVGTAIEHYYYADPIFGGTYDAQKLWIVFDRTSTISLKNGLPLTVPDMGENGAPVPAGLTANGDGSVTLPANMADAYCLWAEDPATGMVLMFYVTSKSYVDSQIASGEPVDFTALNAQPAAPSFTDVPNWCSDAVTWAVDKEITKGTGHNKFSPDDKCKGTEILTFLFRASGETAPETMSPFLVAPYYLDAVNWAWAKGFIDSSFVPDAPCTRASAVKFIWLALGGGSAPSGGFTDVPANADYAAAVDWAVSLGLTNGYGNNEFRPGNTCSRGEIVTFLHRAYVPSVRLK